MKAADFNKAYEAGKGCNIQTNEWFNCAGWFWINLTDKQHAKMIQLMIAQGAEVVVSTFRDWKHCIYLKNGMMLRVD